MTRNLVLTGFAVALVLIGGAWRGSVLAAVPERDDEKKRRAGALATPDTPMLRARAIVDRSLRYVASQMKTDGSYRQGSETEPAPVAVVALSALAFMAAGHSADHEGGFGPNIRRSIDWLLNHTKKLQAFVDPETGEVQNRTWVWDDGDTVSRMHGHGYATWALAMAYGMSFGGPEGEHRRKRLEEMLQACVYGIEAAQAESGGWGYRTEPADHEGSVTITQIQALRAARDAGIRVSTACIQRAVRYIRRSQDMGPGSMAGGFRYRWGDPKIEFALTAAAVSCLNQTGEYDSESIDLAIEFMQRKDPMSMLAANPEPFPYYSRLYATQAYYQYKTLRHFRAYYPYLVERLERGQDEKSGNFTNSRHGNVYATAVSALTLSVPFGYLPSFQR